MYKIIRSSENWELWKKEEVKGGEKVIVYEIVHKYKDYTVRRFIDSSEEDVIKIFNEQY